MSKEKRHNDLPLLRARLTLRPRLQQRFRHPLRLIAEPKATIECHKLKPAAQLGSFHFRKCSRDLSEVVPRHMSDELTCPKVAIKASALKCCRRTRSRPYRLGNRPRSVLLQQPVFFRTLEPLH